MNHRRKKGASSARKKTLLSITQAEGVLAALFPRGYALSLIKIAKINLGD